jgi:hypothetical protein
LAAESWNELHIYVGGFLSYYLFLHNWLNPWSRVNPEKLTAPQLDKKLLAFYGTRRFISAFTRARHLSLSWVRSIQSMPHPTSWSIILILSSHLRLGLPSGLFLSGLLTRSLYAPPYLVPKDQSRSEAFWNFCNMVCFTVRSC